jgi:isoleucyl-tRNA synthetase
VEVTLAGRTIELLPDEVEVVTQQAEGLAAVEDHGWTVALDTELTAELILEGVARDFVRHVANCRKEAGFKVDDRIAISLEAGGKILEAVQAHEDFIKTENLAAEIRYAFEEGEFSKEIELSGESFRIGLERRTA